MRDPSENSPVLKTSPNFRRPPKCFRIIWKSKWDPKKRTAICPECQTWGRKTRKLRRASSSIWAVLPRVVIVSSIIDYRKTRALIPRIGADDPSSSPASCQRPFLGKINLYQAKVRTVCRLTDAPILETFRNCGTKKRAWAARHRPSPTNSSRQETSSLDAKASHHRT